ncbi:Transposon Ty3-G Gag-Pol polyprotein [Cucumis melo var. makuwa]|uniref:Transposon Ty3-G Gag-Pol polyprotein n=1 Tax=Cucumis melo var. makuwa TaxID=1194695 RepID=A0A5D3B8W5_CUCMM|nr:Transposon Ty3-G Gag-Pol polyprotein [Cucumis melo var. makuwa]TYJ96300.1 Transposon Ty3-G Gag-Pol polyprotein [Cucumis melo var. makuwa]
MTRPLQSLICYGVGQPRSYRRKVAVKGRLTDLYCCTDLHCCTDLTILKVAVRRRWAARATANDWKGETVGQAMTCRSGWDGRVIQPQYPKWIAKLLGYSFEVIYKPGLENKAMDALSRKPPDVQLCGISVSTLIDLKTIKEEVESDIKLQKVITELNALGVTPFQVAYGRKPPSLLSYGDGETINSTVDEQLRERDIALGALRKHLRLAQDQMKKYADPKRRDVEYQVGDLVFLRIRPYRQLSLRRKRNEKLSPKFFRPYKILETVGSVAYKLEVGKCCFVVKDYQGMKLHGKSMKICSDFIRIFTLRQGEFGEGE